MRVCMCMCTRKTLSFFTGATFQLPRNMGRHLSDFRPQRRRHLQLLLNIPEEMGGRWQGCRGGPQARDCAVWGSCHTAWYRTSTVVLRQAPHIRTPLLSLMPLADKKLADSGNSIKVTGALMPTSLDLVTLFLGTYLAQLNLDMGAMYEQVIQCRK